MKHTQFSYLFFISSVISLKGRNKATLSQMKISQESPAEAAAQPDPFKIKVLEKADGNCTKISLNEM